jgi:hypothetical protein
MLEKNETIDFFFSAPTELRDFLKPPCLPLIGETNPLAVCGQCHPPWKGLPSCLAGRGEAYILKNKDNKPANYIDPF